MTQTNEEMTSITLWCSYVGKKAPSNAAGQRTGLGRTKKEASENAGHWANQAPFERFKRVTIFDRCESESRLAILPIWAIVANDSPTEIEVEVDRLFQTELYAQGAALWLEGAALWLETKSS